MRDIRDDLRERLRKLEGDYIDEMARFQEENANLLARHRHNISEIDGKRDAVRRLLEIEDRNENEPAAEKALRNPPVERIPLMDFLTLKIEEEGLLSKEDLRAEAKIAGYFQEIDGRAFHTTLVNMVRANRVRIGPDNCYAPAIRAHSLFDADDKQEGEMGSVN